MNRHWHVATTKHQQEMTAAANLRDQGYVIYLAKTYQRFQEGRKIEAIGRLRFPGYVFVAFEPGEHGPINNTRGVDELLCRRNGDELVPLSLSGGIIEILHQIEDEEFDMAKSRAKPEPRTDLKPGDAVLIDSRDHPAKGQTGYLMGVLKGEASILCGMIVWKIPEHDLKLAQQEQRKAG